MPKKAKPFDKKRAQALETLNSRGPLRLSEVAKAIRAKPHATRNLLRGMKTAGLVRVAGMGQAATWEAVPAAPEPAPEPASSFEDKNEEADGDQLVDELARTAVTLTLSRPVAQDLLEVAIDAHAQLYGWLSREVPREADCYSDAELSHALGVPVEVVAVTRSREGGLYAAISALQDAINHG